jgi:hypothetical protein
MVCLDPFKLQTMTAFNQKLLRGVQGGGFLEKIPPGRRRLRRCYENGGKSRGFFFLVFGCGSVRNI